MFDRILYRTRLRLLLSIVRCQLGLTRVNFVLDEPLQDSEAQYVDVVISLIKKLETGKTPGDKISVNKFCKMDGSINSLWFINHRAFKVFNNETKQDKYSVIKLIKKAFPIESI
jgi:hypothetical protein